MLRRPREIALLQRSEGRAHPLLLGRFLANGLGRTRLAISTGRRLGGAVVRNRVRRRIREGLRVLAPGLVPGWDILIVARPESATVGSRELRAALQEILRRGGVLGDRTGS